MDVSENGLDLVKEFEGLRLKAYLDPVGIPTIGYGTIRYPNGRKVALGDSISETEADAFMKFECDQFAAEITHETQGVQLNQNQFDALVSFCFNLGFGAFLGSTLLKKLKASDFAGAAAEFAKWNKGTVDGERVALPGLTKRRAKEAALFQSTAPGGKPDPATPSDQERVATAKGFRSGNANLVAAFDAAGKVVEILELGNSLPETLATAIRLFPNLRTFDFANPGDPLPAGTRVAFGGQGGPTVPPAPTPAPALTRRLLMIGTADSEDPPAGNDVRNLQTRLTDLGYHPGPIDGVFGSLTDRAVKDFQAIFFGAAEADGKVGPLTWGKLWGAAAPAPGGPGPGGPGPVPGGPGPVPGGPGPGNAAPGKNFLSLTKTNTKDEFGLVNLTLAYFKDGLLKASIVACSGQPTRQVFRTGADSRMRSMEPLPEGKWHVGDIEWADGKDNYSGAIWNGGLGPAKIRLDYLQPGQTGRQDIEMHIDWNRTRAPGTAGCVGMHNIADYKTLVSWLRDGSPQFLFVDWGLGTCPAP